MILVTGASGNVGKEVLKQIVQTEAQVRAAFQSTSKAAQRLQESRSSPLIIGNRRVCEQPSRAWIEFSWWVHRPRNFPRSSARQSTSLLIRMFARW